MNNWENKDSNFLKLVVQQIEVLVEKLGKKDQNIWAKAHQKNFTCI
ncbi:hypothetical protein [Nostoc sp.]